MTSLIAVSIVQATLMAAPADEFSAAYARSVANDRPLVVVLGAKWCPACVVMKNSVIPEVAKKGGLKDVEYVYVDVDSQPQLTKKIARGSAIPQLLRFEKQGDKWDSKYLIGGQTAEKVTEFIAGEKAKRPPERKLPFSWSDWTRMLTWD